MNRKISALVAAAAMLGAGIDDLPYSKPEYTGEESDFVKRSKYFTSLAKSGRLFHRGGQYFRPRAKDPKGKLNIKFAKRQKVKAWKAETAMAAAG